VNTDNQVMDFLKSLTLLYVEDDEAAREQFSTFLKHCSRLLITATNGAEGFEAYLKHNPDIIITDIEMPIMDGLLMANQIREQNKSVPIIVLTAFEHSEYFMKAIDVAVYKYVTKPVDVSRFQEALLAIAKRLMIEKQRMNSIVTSSNYKWLSDLLAPPMILGELEQDILKSAIPMQQNIGSAEFTSIKLPLNIVLRRVYYSFKQEMSGRLVPLAHVVEKMAEPALIIQSLKSGRIVISEERCGEEIAFGPNGCLFQYTDYLEQVTKLDTSDDIDAFIVVIGKSVLSELLEKELAGRLLVGLHTEALPSAAVNCVPQHISAILYSSFPNALTGNIRKLFIQSKVLEYISALAEHFANIKEDSRLASPRKQVISQLREELMHLEGKMPTLDEMGRRYGMSTRQLNVEFKILNGGQSIYTFIIEHRLKESHEALLKTDLPMKIISANLGYSHVNNFIIAFRKQFGYTPGSLRRSTGQSFHAVPE